MTISNLLQKSSCENVINEIVTEKLRFSLYYCVQKVSAYNFFGWTVLHFFQRIRTPQWILRFILSISNKKSYQTARLKKRNTYFYKMCPRIPVYIYLRSGRLHFVNKKSKSLYPGIYYVRMYKTVVEYKYPLRLMGTSLLLFNIRYHLPPSSQPEARVINITFLT